MFIPTIILVIILASFELVQSFRFTGFARQTFRNVNSPVISSVTQHSLKLFAQNNVDGTTIEGELKPLQNYVFVRVKEAQQSTISGLILPDVAKEKPTEGIAVSVGSGKHHVDTGFHFQPGVKVGQGVLYGKYDGSSLKYNQENYHLIKDDDILLVFPAGVATVDNVECTRDHILIRLPQKEEKHQSGIYFATNDKDKRATMGTVVKTGPGKQTSNGDFIPVPVKNGDGVKFREYGGTNLKLEGEEFIIVHANDILAKW
jgi:chaperonin GroES